MSVSSVAARRYAKALFELALEAEKTQKGQLEKTRKDLEDLASSLESNAELRALIENPKFTTDAKKKALGAVAQRMGVVPNVLTLVKMLVERRRLTSLSAIAEAFASLSERRSGRVRAEIITASPLADSYYAQLEKTLAEVTGRQVTLVKRTDPSIIGGVVTRVGDTVYDGSIANRLRDIKQQLLEKSAPHTH